MANQLALPERPVQCHMGLWCHEHQTIHGHEAYLLREHLQHILRVYELLNIPHMRLEDLLEELPRHDSRLVLPTPPGVWTGDCLWGHVCFRHDVVHGQEAHQLRQAVLSLLKVPTPNYGISTWPYRRLLRDIPPTDSLCWIESNWEPPVT